MKTKLLLFLASSFSVWALSAQVLTPGQIDDFEDGTTMNWIDGGSPVPPVNIASGGPLGASDNYLSDTATGGGGPGSKMVMFNDQQWAGNYSGLGIISIRFDVRALTNDLDVRIAFDGNGGRICTINAVTITAGGPWQHIEIPISASDFTTVAGGSSVTQTLADVTDMRILSNSVPSWQGESIIATLEIDNIEAATTLGVEDFTSNNSFRIIPNPSSQFLNITTPVNANNHSSLTVYDISGKLVIDQRIDALNVSIPISNWDSGVYFIKVSNAASSQVKKFIKI